MILSAQWFCTETGAVIRIVMLPYQMPPFTLLWAEGRPPFRNFLKMGTPGWRLNLYTLQLKARGRQIFWPAKYIDVITAARRAHPYEVRQADHTLFQRLLQAGLFKQRSPRQQCWRSSSCGPTVSAIPPGWFGQLQDQQFSELQAQLHWPVATPTTKTEKEQSWWWQHRHQDVQGTHAHGVIIWLINVIGQCLSEFIVAGQVSLIPQSRYRSNSHY